MLQFIESLFGCGCASRKISPDDNHKYEQARRLPFAWKYLPATDYDANFKKHTEFMNNRMNTNKKVHIDE